jgi:hypothetical protein
MILSVVPKCPRPAEFAKIQHFSYSSDFSACSHEIDWFHGDTPCLILALDTKVVSSIMFLRDTPSSSR